MFTDIGIDLGTYKIIVYVKNHGIIFHEPSVIAYNEKTKQVIAVGKSAYKMIGKTPSYIKTVRPILKGVICDYDFAEKMISYILKKISYFDILRPRVAICTPSIVTDIEKKAIVDAAINVGARKVFVIDEPIAAALGEGINISKPKGRLVVDIGGGSTDIAVLSLNGIVNKSSIRIAGDNFDEAVVLTVKNKYNFEIGYNTARYVKEKIGCVFLDQGYDNLEMIVKGKDCLTGLPRKQEIKSSDFKDSFDILGTQIINEIKKVVSETPPDLLQDIQNEYLLMTGGGSKLRGLASKIERTVNLKVVLPKNPIESVAKGTGICFKFIKQIDEGIITEDVYKK